VNDDVLKLRLEELAKTKTQVTLSFDNPFWFWRSQCNGGESVIIGVKEE
jgi:hypothetical protein